MKAKLDAGYTCVTTASWNVLFRSSGAAVLFISLLSLPAWGDSQKTQLGTLLVMGDSLSAGFQNFSLYDTAQNAGFAALIADQAGVSLPLPLISVPGIPGMLSIDASGTISRSAATGSRENPTVQAYNISVPGFTLANALAYQVNTAQPITNAIDALALSILAEPGSASSPPCGVVASTPTGVLTLSEVACALKLQPQTIVASIGNNDALQTLIFGTAPTDATVFAAEYAGLLGALSATKAKIVVSNVPDVTVLPFLVPAPAFQAMCHFLPAGVTNADYLVPDITSTTATTLSLCSDYAVRPAALIAQAKSAVASYNTTIKALAGKFGVTVVDVNGLLEDLAAHGYKVRGETLTTAYLGGLLSLDGLHPTNTGYAILANLFIDTMNEKLGTHIKDVNVVQVEKADPLVFGKH